MPDSNCRSCGSDLEIISVCQSCLQASKLTCNNCGYISDEKIHLDCRNSVVRQEDYLNGREIDVQTYQLQLTESIICECKFRLRNSAITFDELELFGTKAKIIKEKNKNEAFQFWLVTNTQNIESEAIEYAKKNNVRIMIATIPSNWHRRSDWSILNLKRLE